MNERHKDKYCGCGFKQNKKKTRQNSTKNILKLKQNSNRAAKNPTNYNKV